MAVYNYKCKNCGTIFEYTLNMNDEKPTACFECKGELLRIWDKINFIRDEGKNDPKHNNYWKNGKSDDDISKVLNSESTPY